MRAEVCFERNLLLLHHEFLVVPQFELLTVYSLYDYTLMLDINYFINQRPTLIRAKTDKSSPTRTPDELRSRASGIRVEAGYYFRIAEIPICLILFGKPKVIQ